MKMQSFAHCMNLIGPRFGTGQVFSDFLELTLCALQLGAAEARYFQIIRRYDALELEVFSKALTALTLEMTGDGSGLIDVLGEYFMQEISHGRNGQFFSPQPLCDMLTGIIRSNDPGYRVADPACGSGRMLLSAAKLSRSLLFFGADNDLTCVHMAVINLCLNGLFGKTAWMDTLTGQWYRSYSIDLHPKGVPFVRQISQEESLLAMKLLVPAEQKRCTLGQQLVFNF
jgi:type I restriction-modification system DNA methylase subunit